MNATDAQHRTPLLLAAIRGGSATISILLHHGADITIKDSMKRNVLHFIVAHGGKLTSVLKTISEVTLYLI